MKLAGLIARRVLGSLLLLAGWFAFMATIGLFGRLTWDAVRFGWQIVR